MKAWTATTLGKEIDLQTGFPFRSAAFTELSEDIKLLRGDNIVQGDIRWDDVKRWPKTDLRKYEDYLLKEGDVVLAMDRPWIEAGLKQAVIQPSDLPCLQVQRTARLRGKGNLTTEYLRYIIASKPFTRYIKMVNTGSSVPHISGSQIQAYTVTLPPRNEQLEIASVLSALDARIELNNRINAELEAMAKLLYDYWFVQFDFPITKAQAASMGRPEIEGKPYRTSGGGMVHNTTLNREIPDGWTAKSLSQLTNVTKSTVTPSKTPEKMFKLYSIPVFDQTGTFSMEPGAKIGSNKFVVTGDDLLVAKLNPWFSRIIFTDADTDAICSTEFVVWHTDFKWMKPFLFIVASSEQFRTHCTKGATGTSNSHKRVRPEVMMDYAIPFEHSIAKAFGELVLPLLVMRQTNQKQNQELAQLRDWLLPMLMNGQVTVR